MPTSGDDHLENEAPLASHSDGYLQAIDVDSLAKISTRLDIRYREPKRPGHFIGAGVSALAIVGREKLSDEYREALRHCVLPGRPRTTEPRCAVRKHVRLIENDARASISSQADLWKVEQQIRGFDFPRCPRSKQWQMPLDRKGTLPCSLRLSPVKSNRYSGSCCRRRSWQSATRHR